MKYRPAAPSPVDQHRDWLSLVDIDGPFLSMPVLLRVWPAGMDRPAARDPQILELMEMHSSWMKSQPAQHEKWIKTVLTVGANWGEEFLQGPNVPTRFKVSVPEHHAEIMPSGVLFRPKSDRNADSPIALVMTVPPNVQLRDISTERWLASPIDRMSIALRRLKVPVGLLSNGRSWAIVWAEGKSTTSSAIFDSLVWNEERYLRDAFFSLIGIQRFVGVQNEDKLPALFGESLLQQEDITEELGKQVRQAVELLVQSLSEARIEALRNKNPDPLPENEHHAYDAAVTIMMRIVFMLFAEERGLLPVNQALYSDAYAVSGLLDLLEGQSRLNEEALDASSAVWHRILSASQALFSGTTFEDMRMPAYGGSLFDPDRFSWLRAVDPKGGLLLAIPDRVMLHVLRSIQKVTQSGYSRKISFREVDVEQIGYIYEGLLGFTSKKVIKDTILGLAGSPGYEPEISLSELHELRIANKSPEKFVEALVAHIEVSQPGSKMIGKTKLVAALKMNTNEAILSSKLGAVTSHNRDLMEKILPFYFLLRRDLRDLPYVVPKNGIVVTETQSRKNAGAHYTPRALAEEVVEHALAPLVFFPGPFESSQSKNWVIKNSAEILNLRVADIAVGSGAFLVAAARYLADRLLDAWEIEGVILQISDSAVRAKLHLSALREVISKCLYGADINEMAIEMCKLSLWLVSLDPTKSFAFLDDKVFWGNSLLGLTAKEQLTQLHISTQAATSLVPNFYQYDVETPLNVAIKIREEISASPVDEFDAHRSASHKSALLNEVHRITMELDFLADAVIAVGLNSGGKSGTRLNSAYDALAFTSEKALSLGSEKDLRALEKLVSQSLIPTVLTDYEKWQPLHWILVVPDVMARGGFDAVIGNPPFLVSKKISGAMGSNMREWLANTIAEKSGKADLVAYFFLRAFSLLNKNGVLGLIGSQALSEGDSVSIGIEPIVDSGGHIFRADTRREWPTKMANTNITIVWASRKRESSSAVLNGLEIPKISKLLTDAASNLSRPEKLDRSIYLSIGNYFLGSGFLIDDEEARQLLASKPVNSDVIRPYVNGQIINSEPERESGAHIIDFKQLTEKQAKVYSDVWKIALRDIKPERMAKDAVKYPKMVNQWWVHWNDRPELAEKLSTVEHAIALSIVSTYLVPVFLKADQVFSSAVVVWPYEDPALFAVLSSWFHRSWSEWWGSSMIGDFRYSLSDCFETYPLPRKNRILSDLGRKLHKTQLEIARARQIGVTKVYRLYNDDSCQDSDIAKLREIHEEIDLAVMRAYKFNLELGPYEISEFCKVIQYGPSRKSRVPILQALLAENERQQEEGIIEWPN